MRKNKKVMSHQESIRTSLPTLLLWDPTEHTHTLSVLSTPPPPYTVTSHRPATCPETVSYLDHALKCAGEQEVEPGLRPCEADHRGPGAGQGQPPGQGKAVVQPGSLGGIGVRWAELGSS